MDSSEFSNTSNPGKGISGWPVLAPQSSQGNNIWIPESFYYPILLHTIKNDLAAHIVDLSPPLILAIQGPAGEGKSFQTRKACSYLGVYVVPISGASLSGTYEKAAVEILENAYVFASMVKKHVQKHTILLIDDFDLSVASTFEERRYTVNTQLLTGFLMNLADDPTRCGTEQTLRIPIIATGNNFQALHTPLTRDGRINFFDWEPTLEMKAEIVRSIFASILLEREIFKIKELVERYPNQPISFFAALKDDLVEKTILQHYKRDKDIDVPSIERAVIKLLKDKSIEMQMLFLLAEKRYAACAWNYLEEVEEAEEVADNPQAQDGANQGSREQKTLMSKFQEFFG